MNLPLLSSIERTAVALLAFSTLVAIIVSIPLAMNENQPDTFPVEIEVDAGHKERKFKEIWRFFGADEPNYATAPNGEKLLAELGKMKPNQVFFRAHNLLTTGDGKPALKWGSTNAYTEDDSVNPIYDWTILDQIFDTYRKRHIRPYVEIGFMPEALSIHPEPYRHHWGAAKNASLFTGWAYQPKDYAKWEELVYQWVKHCVARYGKGEVEHWFWEAWNEPNIGYWQGTPQEFQKLHDYAIAGVRRALPTAKVGGPDTAGGGQYFRDFIEHCLRGQNNATGKTGTPLNFVSFHAKGSPTTLNGHIRTGISNQLRTVDENFQIVASFPELKTIPVVIGESDPEGCAAAGSLIIALAVAPLGVGLKDAPLMRVLHLFTAPDVPELAPSETAVEPLKWNQPVPAGLPGRGLAQHPMLMLGEGYNKLLVVNKGKIIWSYSTGPGWEYDDAWMLSNGNVLFTRMQYIAEVTPKKEVVWRYDAPKGTEIHCCQPIGKDRVLFIVNGEPPKLMVVNIKTNQTEVEHALPFDPKRGVHAQFRRVRYTARGTYLVPFLTMNRVVEYDKDFKEVWSQDIKSPWAAIRLKNGNTLITDEQDALTFEVDPQGRTVWSLKDTDLPEPYRYGNTQSCTRLANGNTIVCSRGGKNHGPQFVEVTRDKKVVWVLQDWAQFGPGTAVQVLDEPCIPERPGDDTH